MEGAEQSKCSDKLGWGKIGGEDCWSPTRRANRGEIRSVCSLLRLRQQEQAVHLLWCALARARRPFTYSAASLCDVAALRRSLFNPDVTCLIAASGVISDPSAAITRLIEAAN